MSRDRGEIQEEKRGGSRGDKNASATSKNPYEIDYSDDRFVKVENDKQAALTENENTYNDMISQSDSYYQSQIDASKQWADKQTQIQNEQTDFAIQQIEQQKENAEKDYIKDQSGAYVDWQTQSKQHGVRAEQMADKGMQNTGYSESSQVSMYNTYQNRVMTAREAFSRAVQNYNNSITQARLTNNAALAEIAKNALQQQLELSLQGFQYKNTLLLDKAAKKLQIEDSYYNRYQDVLQQMKAAFAAEPGDLILILSGDDTMKTRKQLCELRLEVASQLGLRDKNKFSCLWVVDFPLFEYSEEEGRYMAMHHPFTSPKPEDIPLLDTDMGAVRANAYDMVINGVEVGGGSIRIYDSALQNKMFELLGFTPERAQQQFGWLLDAFKYGAPPHGGLAYGLDRWVSLFAGLDSIRDCIAFPKNNSGRDTMIDAPAALEPSQLDELNIALDLKPQK
jgi:aspartyl-tRNA synthetase